MEYFEQQMTAEAPGANPGAHWAPTGAASKNDNILNIEVFGWNSA